jgi:hypothetical protein
VFDRGSCGRSRVVKAWLRQQARERISGREDGVRQVSPWPYGTSRTQGGYHGESFRMENDFTKQQSRENDSGSVDQDSNQEGKQGL